MSWSEAHIKHTAVLAKLGLSASLIAKALNEKFGTSYSKNAVVSCMSRNGIPLKSTFKASPPTQPQLPTMPDGSDTPAAQRCTLLQLKPGVCKWPFGEPQLLDFFFCGGDAIEGKPYCAGHCQVAYRGYWN